MQVFTAITLAIGWIACFYSVGIYIKTQKGWWRSPFGQLIITLSGSLGALLFWIFLARMWPRLPYRSEIATALFVILTLAMIYRAITLTKVLRTAQKEARDAKLMGFSEETQSDS